MTFTFLRIQVHIHPLFWVFLLLFSNVCFHPCLETLLLAGVFLFSLLVHEYGHALTALYFGVTPKIFLEGLGGHVSYNPSFITSKQRWIITLNGPLLESLLIVLPYSLLKLGLFSHYPLVQYTLHLFLHVNLVWCLLNLIPITPLDGGYLLEYFLEKKWGERGIYRSKQVGLLCALVLAPCLYLLGSFFFGSLLLLFGWNQFQEMKAYKNSCGLNNQFFCYTKGLQALRDRDLSGAKSLLKKLLNSQTPSMKTSATESLAKIYLEENKSQKAYDLLLQADPDLLKEGKCLLCRLAFERGDYELIGKYARDIYILEPTQEIALLNAKAFAHLEQMQLSKAWEETAAQFEAPIQY